MRSASATPSEEEEEDDDLVEASESASVLTDATPTYQISSPVSARHLSMASYASSSSLYSPGPASRVVTYSVPSLAQLPDTEGATVRGDRRPRPRPSEDDNDYERSVMSSKRNFAPAVSSNEDQLQVVYPLRLNDQHHMTFVNVQSPTETVTGLSTTSTTIGHGKRSSDAGFRPIAKRPANYRPEADFHDAREPVVARSTTDKVKGRKKPYKNQEERDKVKAVRKLGACLRCQIMRQACEVTEDGQQCQNCLVKRRKFNIPCTRTGPSGRCDYLFPELVTSRHAKENHKAFIGKQMPGSFRLPLTHASGFSVELDVVEDASIPETDLEKSLFVEQGQGEQCVQQMVTDRTVPLVPVISTGFKDVAEWLAGQITIRTPELFVNLHIKVFPEAKGQHWPREVLCLFQEFHQSVLRSRHIKHVFRTLIVRHLMSRPFYVPFPQLNHVNQQLSPQYQETEDEIADRIEENICMIPKFVNRYFKSALMHLLKRALTEDLVQLEELMKLGEKSPGSEITDVDRDEALCYTAVILMIVAIQQSKILQVAQSRDREASRNCPLGRQTQSLQKAKEVVTEIEVEVIDHILGLFSYKFVKSNRKGPIKPELVYTSEQTRSFNLVERFNQTRIIHREQLSTFTELELDLDDDNLPKFLLNNVTRVLLRFAEVLTPSKPRAAAHQ